MRRFWVLTAALFGFFPANSPAQTPSPDDKSIVSFDTADHVRITGSFYKGAKGADSPTVMMIHRFKSDRSAKGWDALATYLRDKLNCSVLSFDLRGHGGSKSVQTKFWAFDHNKSGIRGGQAAKAKSEISFNDFKGNYWPVLMNDFAAARYFLDQRNDEQQCNSSSIFVIAAEDSAGLAMGWVTNEWDRAAVPSGTGFGATGVNVHYPGEDIAAGIWLGPASRGGSVAFRPNDWFGRNSKLRESTPMYYLYGKDDPNASMVTSAMTALKKPPEGVRTKHTFDKEEKLNTKLPGQDLVSNPSLDVNKKVEAYIDNILKNFRKNVGWKEMRSSPPALVPLPSLGFQQPG